MNRLIEVSEKRGSRLLLSLDFVRGGLSDHLRLLSSVREYIVGVKVGVPTLLRIGPSGVGRLIEEFSDGLYFLADLKLSDIPSVVAGILEELREVGFSGAVLHLFPMGYEDVVREARRLGLELFGVTLMSHPGARLFQENFERLLFYAAKLDLEGVVVAANRPNAIRRARDVLGEGYVILSPGIGAQGAKPGEGIAAGADVEIVGRAIVLSDNPREAARRIYEEQVRRLCSE